MGSSCFERPGNVERFMAGQEHRPGKRGTTSTHPAQLQGGRRNWPFPGTCKNSTGAPAFCRL